MDMVVDVYHITDSLPKSEVFGLTSQIRRAAVSIPSNIAEGAARKNKKELIQFLYISLGSISEVETQIEICERLRFIAHSDELNGKIDKIRRMLVGLIRKLKNSDELK